MFKKLLLAVMVALPSMTFAQKFGIIETESIMSNLPEMKEIQTQLQAAGQKYEAEFKSLQDEAQKKYTEFQQMDESTPKTIQERRIQEIQDLDQKIQQFRQTASEDLQRQQEQLIAPVRQKVFTAIQSVGAEGNFTFIFENVMPLYTGTDVIDVTPLVKAKLGMK